MKYIVKVRDRRQKAALLIQRIAFNKKARVSAKMQADEQRRQRVQFKLDKENTEKANREMENAAVTIQSAERRRYVYDYSKRRG